MKRVDVLTEIEIRRSVSDVAAYATDPDNAPKWYANIETVERRTEPPLKIGSVVGFRARFLGRQLAYDHEFLELQPGERLVMRTQHGPFPMETTYTWSEVGVGRTRMTLRNVGTPTRLSAAASMVMVPAMRRADRADLFRLKAILEAEPPIKEQP